MKSNIPIRKIFFLFGCFLLFINTRGQVSFRTYTHWDHPVIKALERRDPAIVGFPRPGNHLANVCIADTSTGTVYYVSQYGFIFDTLHLTEERKEEIRTAGKQANPFRWYEDSIGRFLTILQDAKELLRENGNNIRKASYVQQRLFSLPLIKAASSPLAKLLVIEEYERAYSIILVHFSWWINQPRDTAIQNRIWEHKKPGSLIIHGTASTGYSEFVKQANR